MSDARIRRLGLAAVALVATGLLVSAGGAGAEPPAPQVRSETEAYSAAPQGGVDCASNSGGACFELQGDERTVGILVNDAEGWVGIPLHYAFASQEAQTLAEGTLCDKGWVPVPKDAVALAIQVTAIAGQTDCNQATVSTGGEITVTYSLKKGGQEPTIDGERECIGGFVPEPVSMQLQGRDTGQRIALDTLVLIDTGPGVIQVDEAARDYMQDSIDAVVKAYDAIGITVRYEFRDVVLTTPAEPSGLYDVGKLFNEIKASVGGSVPEGFDVVHTMTTKDINGAAGVANCVGGIRSRTRAFSVGEEIPGKVPNLIAGTPVPAWPWEAAGYIATHEIGHLLGGNHDYANCAEGWLDQSGAAPGPCTIMHPNFNITFQFSTLNRIEIREYAIRWAAP